MSVTKNIEPVFHSFCEDCPMLQCTAHTEKLYANDRCYETHSTVTCKHYDFCEQLARAGIIKA